MGCGSPDTTRVRRGHAPCTAVAQAAGPRLPPSVRPSMGRWQASSAMLSLRWRKVLSGRVAATGCVWVSNTKNLARFGLPARWTEKNACDIVRKASEQGGADALWVTLDPPRDSRASALTLLSASSSGHSAGAGWTASLRQSLCSPSSVSSWVALAIYGACSSFRGAARVETRRKREQASVKKRLAIIRPC